MREAARAIVEAGADVVAGHGPHLVRGIEVIDGAPVFYGLGSFVFQPHLMHEQPYDAFEEFGLPLTQALFS
jgi:poly-gamma-glutamate synthesis protein (capsule biosynthesis protein)